MDENPYQASMQGSTYIGFSACPRLATVSVLARYRWGLMVSMVAIGGVGAGIGIFFGLYAHSAEEPVGWVAAGGFLPVSLLIWWCGVLGSLRKAIALAEDEAHLYIWPHCLTLRNRCLRIPKRDVLGFTRCWVSGEGGDAEAIALLLDPAVATARSAQTFWRKSIVQRHDVTFDPEQDPNACIIDCEAWATDVEETLRRLQAAIDAQ